MRILLLILAISFLMACEAPKSYVRTYTYVPFNEQGGDINLSGALALNHVEGMAAFSPIKHLNLLAQGYTGTRGNIYDFGIGTYYQVDRIKLQLTGGIGQGVLNSRTIPWTSSTHSYQDTRTYYIQDSRFEKRFLQPSLELIISNKFSLGMAKRYNWVNYTKWELKKVEEVINNADRETQILLSDRNGLIGDLLLFVNFRHDPVTLSFQYGTTDDDFRDHGLPKYTANFYHLSAGINLNVFGRERVPIKLN